MVIDADGLWYLIQESSEAIRSNIKGKGKNVILTPNLVEMERIIKFLKVENKLEFKEKYDLNDIYLLQNISDYMLITESFGNCGIIIKGKEDVVIYGNEGYVNTTKGCIKRCGGIGDILSGVAAQYLALSLKLPHQQITTAQCLAAACALVREASRLAEQDRGISLTAPYIINNLALSWKSLVK